MNDGASVAAGAAAPVLRPVWIVGVIGHRTLAAPAPLERVVTAQLEMLRAAAGARGGEIHLLCSVAAGTDLIAIRAARRLNLPVHLLLPLPDEEFFEDFADAPAALAEARAALAEARARLERDSVNIVLTSGGRPDCYFDTDVRIVESSDLVVAVWDGLQTDKLGGTAQLAALAEAMKKPVVQIHPATLAVTSARHDAAQWPPGDEQWDRLARMGIFAPDAAAATDEDRSRAIKNRLSTAANADAFDFRRAAQLLIILGALAGLAGLTHGILAKRVPGGVVTALQATQLVLSLLVLHRRWSITRSTLVDKWTNARIGAEIWRGLASSLPFTDPLRPTAGQLLPEWRRVAVSLGTLVNRYRQPHFARQAVPLAAFKDDYGRERLENQHKYYTRELGRSARWSRRLPAIARRCSQATPAFVVLAMLNRAAGLGWDNHPVGIIVVAVLPAFLPIIAAVADGLVSTFDHQRRQNRFSSIVLSLELLRTELKHLGTEDSVRKLVERCERLLLSEQVEWRHVTKKVKV